AAKKAYKAAVESGNRQEEARWANVIGDILKNRGEYVEALVWLRKDYDISTRYLPEKQLLATCQSLGELHLRLEEYDQALIYQKKHLELAKDQNDLIEQQRASTQLGRTYHEMFLKSDDDHWSIRNVKKYFESAMELAKTVMNHPPSERVSFVKEYVDAHNNIGMLQIDLDNFDEAEKFLHRGLEICDEEELPENDDARSRLHHNLGNVYLELRKWEKAHHHIKKDILICKHIGHLQGEAKGYINLGELNYRTQKYTEAIASYQKASDIAKSLEDEHTLSDQIHQNIQTVSEAVRVMNELKQEEQNLKKLERKTEISRNEEAEWKCFVSQRKSLNSLVEKSRMIFDWIKLRQFAKKKKRVEMELFDTEKLCDSYLIIGEAYEKLRKFSKALKWYKKGWETYRLIGNLEGEALAKINIGDVLDSTGDWSGALDAFREGYRIAVDSNLPSLQLSALENVHYSHMIRFNNVEEARKTKLLIDKFKCSTDGEMQPQGFRVDSCSETGTESNEGSVDDRSGRSLLEKSNECHPKKVNSAINGQLNPNMRSEPIYQNENVGKQKEVHDRAFYSSPRLCKSLEKSNSVSTGSFSLSRKRARAIISDDEVENEDHSFPGMTCRYPEEARSNNGKWHSYLNTERRMLQIFYTADNIKAIRSPVHEAQVTDNFCKRLGLFPFFFFPTVGSRCTAGEYTGPDLESSPCSLRSKVLKLDSHGSQSDGTTKAKFVYLPLNIDVSGEKACMEWVKVELACLYYLQLPREKRSKGRVPLVQHLMCGGRIFESVEELREQALKKGWIEVSVGFMVMKHLMGLYVECCEKLSLPPIPTLVHKLYETDVSEDEIIVSECQMQDYTILPLLDALQLHKPLALLDLSHNSLGNGTVEKLKKVFTSSGQSYGGLFLNLHSNRLGPAALFEICECPLLYGRLEVLDVSGNCLTDACASYLSTIIRTCKGLYSLNIEKCSLTSRTFQRITDSLDSENALTHLYIGLNHPVSGNVVIRLVLKLATLSRFQELSLRGIKLSKPVVDSLSELACNCCLSGLLLGSTNIGNEGAVALIRPLSKETHELVKLDLSFSGISGGYVASLRNEPSLVGGLLELNLGGNPIKQEGSSELASLLRSPHCCLRVLEIGKCQLGLVGTIRVLQALSENDSLEELNVSGNADPAPDDLRVDDDSFPQILLRAATPEKNDDDDDGGRHEVVADSEDDLEADDDVKMVACSSASPSSKKGYMQELAASVRTAAKLKALDLSDNGFSREVAEILFSEWSSSESRAGFPHSHVDGNLVHFSVWGHRCCGIKPCCRK
ncbi:hypothetical protein M569_09649, partial [Genlisea aurea]